MPRRVAPQMMKIEDENENEKENDSPSIRVSSVSIRGSTPFSGQLLGPAGLRAKSPHRHSHRCLQHMVFWGGPRQMFNVKM
jgi:hypothetical protein